LIINFIPFTHICFCTARSSWLKQETDVLLRVLHQALHLSQKSPSITTNNNDKVTIHLKTALDLVTALQPTPAPHTQRHNCWHFISKECGNLLSQQRLCVQMAK